MTELADFPWVHSKIDLKTGITMHFVERGKGPCVILCHGFPEFWYSWRYQIIALSDAGYRVIAPDQRGFGYTSCPKGKEQYCLENTTKDIVALMDALSIPKAILIGHDWGSPVVWSVAQNFEDRVIAVGSLVVPYFPPNPKKNPLKSMLQDPGRFDYQLYFQEENIAESEFEKDIYYSILCFIRSSKKEDWNFKSTHKISLGNARERGGMLVGYPKEIKRTLMFSEKDLQMYVDAFKTSGFRGGVSWYRNFEENWKWNCKTFGQKITIPTLFVSVAKDPLFPPSLSALMESSCTNLTKGHIEESGHWIQSEAPKQLNQILLNWLNSLNVKQTNSKLIANNLFETKQKAKKKRDCEIRENQNGNYGTKGIASSSNIPGARYIAVSWIDSNNNLFLFGGTGYDPYSGYLNDLWKFQLRPSTTTTGDNATSGTAIRTTSIVLIIAGTLVLIV